MAITLADEYPLSGATAVPVDQTISFGLQSSLEIDQDSLAVTVGGLEVYTGSEFQDGFVGTCQSDGSGGFVFTIQSDTNFLYNRAVPIIVTGEETGLIPFTESWSFSTTILTNIAPAGSATPDVVAPELTTAAVDQGVTFRVAANSNPPTSQSILLVSLTVAIDGDSAVIAGVVNTTLFTGSVDSDGTGGYIVNVRNKQENFEFATIIQVDVSGTETPILTAFSQSFNFQTTESPVFLDDVQVDSITEVQGIYSTVKDDGAIYQETRINVATLDTAGVLTDVTTPNAFSMNDGGRAITITDSALGNERVARIEKYVSASQVILTEDPYLLEVGTFSYTLDTKVVSGSTTQQSGISNSSPNQQVQNSTNGIFLAVQQWAERHGALRTSFTPAAFLTVSAVEWPVTDSASAIADPHNGSISTRRFSDVTQQGVGFQIRIAEGTNGLRFLFAGKAATSNPAISYVGLALHYRQVPNSTVVSGSWDAIALDDIVIPAANIYYQYTSQVVSLSDFAPVITPGLVYQFELVRTPPNTAGGTNLSGYFHLMEMSIDFG